MNSAFKKHIHAYGSKGEQWLQNIPELISAFESKWNFRALAPYPLSYNYVAPVILSNGVKAVFKLGYPDDDEFRSEIYALLTCNGQGICRLLQSDTKQCAMLIEHIDPGTPLSQEPNDEQATRIIASVMKKMWRPIEPNHSCIPIKRWTRALYEYPKTPLDSSKPSIPLTLVMRAKILFEELIQSSSTSVLTHGDLHHDNILLSQKRGWIAIDPKGIVAEPAYDVAAMIRNPYKLFSRDVDFAPLLKRRIQILSEELDISAKRLHGWCMAQTILSGVWTVDHPPYTMHALRIVHALNKISL